ncbi:MAG: uroporphyrinogen-III synthase [Gemmatimonadaceae bacterium]
MTAPLAGRRVLVTRALEDAAAWADRLAALGADPVILPCIRTELLDDAATRTQLAAALRDADWLCIMSPRGADAVARIAGPLASAIRVAVVGTATAHAVVAALGRQPYVASGGTSRALGEELLREIKMDVAARPRVVVASSLGGRRDAEDTLGRGGIAVTRVDVYRTIPAGRAGAPRDLAGEGIGDVLLASPSAVEGLLNQAAFPGATRLFTIGPTTSAAVIAAGLSVSGEAMRPDLDSLVEAMQ